MNNSTEIICDIFRVELEVNPIFHVTLSIIVILISILTISLNSMYLIVVYKFSKLFSISDILYIFLAVSDLLTGVILMPAFAGFWIYTSYSGTDCTFLKFVNACAHTFTLISVLTISLITTDVYASIVHPFAYRAYFTKKIFYATSAVVWIISITFPIIFVLIAPYYWYIYQNISGSMALSAMMALCVMHYKIHLSIKQLSCQINFSSAKENENVKTKRKASKLAVSILITLIACFLPSLIYFFYITIHGTTTKSVSYVFQTTGVIVFLNAFFDPFVYYFRLGRVRTKIKKMFMNTVAPESTTKGVPSATNRV